MRIKKDFLMKKLSFTWLSQPGKVTSYKTQSRYLGAAVFFLGSSLLSQVNAGTMGSLSPSQINPWSLNASLGYTLYQNMYQGDGQTAIGRLGIGKQFFTSHELAFGLEVGVQNGNTMRLNVDQNILDILGGLPIQSTMKPMLDLLATVKTSSLGNTPLIAEIKGGIAYRRWQFDNRTAINDLSRVDGEVQAGLAYPINNMASISLAYQGVFGSNPDYRIFPLSESNRVSNIPIQNGVLLGLSLTI